jgi:membrane protease YdiL (CAAX protease family)
MKSSMPASPAQNALNAIELTLLLAGAGLVLWLLVNPRLRQRWLGTNALPHWPVTLPEFLFGALLVFAQGFLLQSVVQTAFGSTISGAVDRTGLELFVYGAGFHAGILSGCAIFPVLRRRLYADYGGVPPSLPRRPTTLSWLEILRYGAATVIIALPVLTVLSLGWTEALRVLGLPDAPQDLIKIFAETRSPWVIAGMLIVACVFAPLSEELLFRAGLYRFVRQKLGRMPALLISGICFGLLHGNWAGFLPLAVLGMILALAYEATGSIRVAIVAHGLFNLNTILLVLASLHRSSP